MPEVVGYLYQVTSNVEIGNVRGIEEGTLSLQLIIAHLGGRGCHNGTTFHHRQGLGTNEKHLKALVMEVPRRRLKYI